MRSLIYLEESDAACADYVVEGRTPEQKRKIAERITAVLIEDGRAKRENIHVSFHDVSPSNYAEAGILVADQKRTP